MTTMNDETSIIGELEEELEATLGGSRAETSEAPGLPRRFGGSPGSWFGFSHQPGLFLGGRALVELVVDPSANAHMRDEHGLARVEIEDDPDYAVAFRKTYDDRVQSFVYRGRMVGRRVVGYWRSERHPSFVGTFALVSETELTVAHRQGMRARIPRWSLRRASLFALIAVVVALPILARAGVRFGPVDGRLFAALPLLAIVTFAIALRRSARTMNRRVTQLRRELAKPQS